MNEHIDGCVQPGDPRYGLDPSTTIDAAKKGHSAGFVRNKEKRVIGVIGLGSVGRALRTVMSYFYDVVGYDIVGEYNWGTILDCEVVFVCVQTPQGPDGRLDCSCVEDVLERLQRDSFGGIIVIKSTLRVGFMDRITKKFPCLNLVYSPEFMSEKNALAWTANPDRIVLSGNEKLVNHIQGLYFWAEGARVIRTDFKSAEIGKLAHNAYIATKVTFTNTMEKIAETAGANAYDVMEIVYSDRRVANSAHLEPYKGPYDGKCVPKDTTELINAFGSTARLLRVVDEINKELLNSPNISDEAT